MPPARPTTNQPPPSASAGLCPATVPGALFDHSAGIPDGLYAHLRERHPVYLDAELEVWVVSRYADIDLVLRDTTGAFTNAQGYTPLQRLCPQAQAVLTQIGWVPVLSSTDPPAHTRFRRITNAVWPTTPHRLAAHNPAITHAVTSCAENFAARPGRHGDLVTHYAQPATMAALADLIGLPSSARQTVGTRAEALTALVFGRLTSDQQLTAAEQLRDLWHDCAALTADRLREPRDDLLSAWLRHPDADGPLTAEEAASTLMEVLITGAEIIPRLLTLTCHRLLTAGALADLDGNENGCAQAVEDTLRHDPPLIGWQRATTREVDLSGIRIPAGARLLLLLGSAARDPLAPTSNASALAFGAGMHYCPGAAFTRHFTAQALAALARACPHLVLDTAVGCDPNTWPPNAVLRGPHLLPVTW
ncbi:hypothetical protein ACBR40_27265 [Nonomuraea sp. AD125B]|uniref:hypothetical protein n=1 Tax=Nonomuraea sp. AD125B TaxID=3242897 RepID=UPI0035279FFF